MCIDGLTEYKENETKPTVGYKVVAKTDNPNEFSSLFYAWRQNFNYYVLNRKGFDVATPDMGFNCFFTKEDAMNYGVSGREVIVKVKVKEVRAHGRQISDNGFVNAFTCGKMKIVEVLEYGNKE